jgi:hypothetical protein
MFVALVWLAYSPQSCLLSCLCSLPTSGTRRLSSDLIEYQFRGDQEGMVHVTMEGQGEPNEDECSSPGALLQCMGRWTYCCNM